MNGFDLTGKTFGYLTVIRREGLDNTRRNSTWLCECKCGKYTIVTRASLVSEHTISCGCRQFESKNFTHKMSKTRLYYTWYNMRVRCNRDTGKNFKDYKGRGITVCNEWEKDFVAFMEWAHANGYTEEMTIDRIDNNKGYSPDNCRWVPMAEQQRNKTTTIYINYNGEKRRLRDVCIETGFPYKRAHKRYRKLIEKGEEVTAEYIFAPVKSKN